MAPSLPPIPSLPPNSLRASLIESLRTGLPESLRPGGMQSLRPSLLPKLRERSISPWAVLAMALTALPLAVSVLVAQALFSRDVVTAYDDVATRFEEHVVPTNQLELAIWEGQTRANQYRLTKDPQQLAAYRLTRALVRAKFASLKHYAQSDDERDALDRARGEWDKADDLVEGSLVAPQTLDAKNPESGNNSISAAVANLRHIEAGLALDMRAQHVAIAAAHERSKIITFGAAGLSLLVFLTTVLLIWRSRTMIGRLARVIKRQAERRSRISIRAPDRVA